VFGTLFTTRLTEKLTDVFTKAGASASDARGATATLSPGLLNKFPDALHTGVVDAYASALAPVFWYVLPFIALAFLLALFLKQIPLSDQAGLVARGEAIGGEEAERLEAELRAAQRRGGAMAEPSAPSTSIGP
jgi:hypothetical protein